jgi:RNA polymerase-binding protein DksA
MTNAELAHYRRLLLALKKRVVGDLTELEEETLRPVGGEASGDLSDVPLDPADLGSDNYEEEFSLGRLQNEDQLIDAINDALERIEQGTFGRCQECHKEISRERLNALPYTRYCIQCARTSQNAAERWAE